jgi:hypothetical protein
VAGVVLIDSMYPGQGQASPADVNTPSTRYAPAFSFFSVLARVGAVRVLARRIGLFPAASPAEKARYGIAVSPKSIQTQAEEMRSIPESLSQAGAVKSLGELPLIVLSRGLNQNPDWQAGQTGLLQLSSNSRLLFAERSGHDIGIDQPEAAVEAIVTLVQMVRQQQVSAGANPIQLDPSNR